MKNDINRSECERIVFRRICRMIFLFFIYLIFSSNLVAGSSCSQTITIRVIRPTVFTSQNVSSVFSANTRQSENTVKLQWKANSRPKRITASVMCSESNPQVHLQWMREKGSESDRKIILDRSERECISSIQDNCGSVILKCSVGPDQKKAVQGGVAKVFYTVLDI